MRSVPSDTTIIATAKQLGADLAGIANVGDLKESPSHLIGESMPGFDNFAARQTNRQNSAAVKWPEGGKSAIVIAMEHPEDKPEHDWWILGGKAKARNTPGNRMLMSIMQRLRDWLESEGVRCFPLSYHIESGGIYMKDAAVLAGLGCIGKNNILITPEYGPRLRLRTLLIDSDIPSSGPLDFDPCHGCDTPCRSACPANAFEKQLYTPDEYGLDKLPGRTGVYSRLLCSAVQDSACDNYERVENEGWDGPVKMVKFCRECEWACPAGAK